MGYGTVRCTARPFLSLVLYLKSRAAAAITVRQDRTEVHVRALPSIVLKGAVSTEHEFHDRGSDGFTVGERSCRARLRSESARRRSEFFYVVELH
jgi:hypothetical protein